VVRLPAKSTVAEAIKVSGILDAGDPVGGEQKLEVGIWGKTCALSHLVHAGDRIEIYRPLQITPMDARKLRASNNKKKLR
jgi:putative ubiquitin-RnfH superfamily antitoxin RatB of RatAB toxin-antitoxin module